MKNRFVKYFYFISVYVLLITIGCNRTNKEWEKAKQANTIKAYIEYQTAHPDSIIEIQALMYELNLPYRGINSPSFPLPVFKISNEEFYLVTDETTIFKKIDVSNGSVSYSLKGQYLMRGKFAKKGEIEELRSIFGENHEYFLPIYMEYLENNSVKK